MPDSDLDHAVLFREVLKTSESVVAALIDYGYTSLEELAYVPAEELAKALVFEQASVPLLQEQAREYLLDKALGVQRGSRADGQ